MRNAEREESEEWETRGGLGCEERGVRIVEREE